MRGLSVAAVLAVWLLPASPARAGVYNTEERLLDLVFGHPNNYTRSVLKLQQVVAEALENDPKSARNEVLQRVKYYEQELAEGRLPLQGKVNLSAYYIRLNQPEKAVALLEALPRAQRDFMAWSNLATASQLAGNLERAEAYLTEALDHWPQVSVDTDSWRLNWLRVAEKYHLALIRARLREQRQAPGAPQSVDAIFPNLRFVGPSGQYEAGLLAANQWSHLPATHTEIVKLLVLWMPHDARLRWLLAEIVNANGDAEGALEMMNELADVRKFGNPEFAAHQRELRHAKGMADHLQRLRPRFLEEKVKVIAPVGGILPSGPAAALEAAATVVALEKVYTEPLPEREYDLAPAPTDSPATAPAPSAGWTPEWRQIAVSFVAGVIVAALLSLQLRELRKRKSDAQPASRE
jgi:hypothetical protein